jgi:hypothetical protein
MSVTRTRRRVHVLAEPCACNGDRTCLYHYSQLAGDQRAKAKLRGGVRDAYNHHRKVWKRGDGDA